jgi:S1-C subfamily serine protease
MALAALLPAAASAQTSPGRVPAGMFRIQATDAQGRDVFGTAVLIAPAILVTNCHVVLDARAIAVEVGTTRPAARVVKADTERDVCLLAGPELDAPVATLGTTAALLPGASITSAGYSRGGSLVWNTGQVEGLYSYDGRGRVIQGSAAFDEGASGGGLFDSAGRLVGILTFKARAGGPFHFAAPVEWAADLLADTSPADRRDGTAFWRHTDAKGPPFMRVASLAARGDCAALAEVAGQWLKKEPNNPEAGMAARNLHYCQLFATDKAN